MSTNDVKYQDYERPLYKYAMKLTGGNHHWSEDLVQDVLMLAYTCGNQIKEKKATGAYLRTTLWHRYLRTREEYQKQSRNIAGDAIADSPFPWLHDLVQPDLISSHGELVTVQNEKMAILKNHLSKEQIDFLLCWIQWSGNTREIAKEFANPASRIQMIQKKLGKQLRLFAQEGENELQLSFCLPVEPVDATGLLDVQHDDYKDDKNTLEEFWIKQRVIQYRSQLPRLDVVSFRRTNATSTAQINLRTFYFLCLEAMKGLGDGILLAMLLCRLNTTFDRLHSLERVTVLDFRPVDARIKDGINDWINDEFGGIE